MKTTRMLGARNKCRPDWTNSPFSYLSLRSRCWTSNLIKVGDSRCPSSHDDNGFRSVIPWSKAYASVVWSKCSPGILDLPEYHRQSINQGPHQLQQSRPVLGALDKSVIFQVSQIVLRAQSPLFASSCQKSYTVWKAGDRVPYFSNLETASLLRSMVFGGISIRLELTPSPVIIS